MTGDHLTEGNDLDRLKMYCIVSREALALAKGNRGKMMAQAGHAFLHAYWDSAGRGLPEALHYMHSERAFKVTVVVEKTVELIDLHLAYQPICGVSLVKDAGLTVFKEPTITCLGIGPIRESQCGDDLKKLRLLV